MMNLNEMRENLETMQNGWYGRLSDITEKLEDMGIDHESIYASREYVTFATEDEDGEYVEVVLHLGGTEQTITVAGIECDRF